LTIILPAGDVFVFEGMSADSDPNVFTAITYLEHSDKGTVGTYGRHIGRPNVKL
jgi:hypothetical protein